MPIAKHQQRFRNMLLSIQLQFDNPIFSADNQKWSENLHFPESFEVFDFKYISNQPSSTNWVKLAAKDVISNWIKGSKFLFIKWPLEILFRWKRDCVRQIIKIVSSSTGKWRIKLFLYDFYCITWWTKMSTFQWSRKNIISYFGLE